ETGGGENAGESDKPPAAVGGAMWGHMPVSIGISPAARKAVGVGRWAVGQPSFSRGEIAHCSHCSLLIAHLRNGPCQLQGTCPDSDLVNAKEFSERLWDLAAEVARLVESIPDTRVGRHVAGQLIRCGTSSAPNYDEACDAESRRDFAHKLALAAKEMRETSG